MGEEDDERLEAAPEGASCAEHPSADAIVTCPRCGSYCCLVCWQAAARRCHACLLRDPGPLVPWADPERGALDRFFSTLADAVRPGLTAPSFTRGEWRRGISFALLTFLPLALLAGVIPFTHTLGFGPSFAVTPLGDPSPDAIALDVVGAMGLGLLVAGVKIGILGAAFLSVAAAYGKKLESQPGRQALLYRAWLLPLSSAKGIVLGLLAWAVPLDPEHWMGVFAAVASLVPLMLLLAALISTARQAYGVGPFASLVVVIVPFLLLYVTEQLLMESLGPLLPSGEAVRAEVEAAR